MTTQELEQLGKLIDTKLEPIKKDMATRQDMVSVRQEIASVTQELALTKQEIMAAVQQLTEDMADFFHETWKVIGKTDQLITEIEDRLDIPHPQNN